MPLQVSLIALATVLEPEQLSLAEDRQLDGSRALRSLLVLLLVCLVALPAVLLPAKSLDTKAILSHLMICRTTSLSRTKLAKNASSD
jgi:hypothetical protein